MVKKRLALVWLCCLVGGCVTMEEGPNPTETGKRVEISRISGMSRRFISLGQIYPGMTRKEVQSALGAKVIVGYELSDPQTQQYKPTTLDNPYRIETLKKGKKEYNIDYYLAGVQQADDVVSDDELVPLAFENDKLIGLGWPYFNENIKEK